MGEQEEIKNYEKNTEGNVLYLFKVENVRHLDLTRLFLFYQTWFFSCVASNTLFSDPLLPHFQNYLLQYFNHQIIFFLKSLWRFTIPPWIKLKSSHYSYWILPLRFRFPARHWFTLIRKITQPSSHSCHISFPLRLFNAVLIAWNDLSHPLATKMLLQADYLQSLCQIIPFFHSISLPLYTWMHSVIFVYAYITLSQYFVSFTTHITYEKLREMHQNRRGPWSLKLIKISVRKSTFKMYQVLRVGDCLRQSLLVTYILRFCTEGDKHRRKRSRERGEGTDLFCTSSPTEDQLGWGEVEHLDLNQIWSFDYYRDCH